LDIRNILLGIGTTLAYST